MKVGPFYEFTYRGVDIVQNHRIYFINDNGLLGEGTHDLKSIIEAIDEKLDGKK